MVWSFRGACAVALTAVIAVALVGCGIQVPGDPNGTLQRVSGGELRVGASPSGKLVTVTGEGTGVQVSGALASSIEQFAATRDATVAWTIGSEEDLVDLLETGDLDLAIGGMTDATPWADRVSVTRGYSTLPDTDGQTIVVLLPLGENALQSAVEIFLDSQAR